MVGLLDRYLTPEGADVLGILGSSLMAAGARTTDPGAAQRTLAQGLAAAVQTARQGRLDKQTQEFRKIQQAAIEAQTADRTTAAEGRQRALGLLHDEWQNPDVVRPENMPEGAVPGATPYPTAAPRRLGLLSQLPQAQRPFIEGIAQQDPSKAYELGLALSQPKKPIIGPAGATILDPTTYQPIRQIPQAPTATQQDYEYAKKSGFTGTFSDYQLQKTRELFKLQQEQRNRFMDLLGGGGEGALDLEGGAGNDTLGGGAAKDTITPSTLLANDQAPPEKPKQPTVKELFDALPPEVQAGIKASPDPQRAFSTYMVRQKGLQIEFDDQGRVKAITQGTTGPAGGMQKSTAGDIEKALFTAREGMARLSRIEESFKPEYLTIPEKLSNWWTASKEKMGLGLKPEEKQALTEYTAFRRNAFDNINRYIKEITGAQMSEAEADRLRQSMPDPANDSPTEFAAGMNATFKTLRMAAARHVYTLRSGLDPKSVSIDSMAGIVNKRGEQVEKEIKTRNPSWDEDQVRSFTRQVLSAEFGLTR